MREKGRPEPIWFEAQYWVLVCSARGRFGVLAALRSAVALLTEALAKLSVVLAMAGSWTRAYLFGGDSPPNRTALNEEEMPEFDLEPGVSSIGSGVGSVGVGSILREHSQSLEGRNELEAAAEADQSGSAGETELSTIQLGIDTVGGHDKGVQTDVSLTDDATRNLLLLLLQSELNGEDNDPAEKLSWGPGATAADSAPSVAASTRKPRSVPQDPRKFRSEASQEKERARRNAKKALKKKEARLGQASCGDKSPL